MEYSQNIPHSIEYELKNDDVAYYLHIPKTAGTSLNAVLESYFDLDTIFQGKSWQSLILHKPKNFSKIHFFSGHFGYGLHRILKKKPVFFTMLRDPIQRTISDYYHIRRDPTFWHDNRIYSTKSITNLLDDPQKGKMFFDIQTRYIGLDPNVISITKPWDIKSINQFRIREVLAATAKKISNEKLLSNAKKHLSEFEFFGLAEKFEESMFLLFYTFGWKPITSVWTLNVSQNRKDIADLQLNTNSRSSVLINDNPKLIEKIQSCNKLDIELYGYAKQLFEQRYNQMIQELKKRYYESSFEKLEQKEAITKMLEKHYESRIETSKPVLVNSLDYDFSQKMSGSGWYWREVLDESEETFRWTGPQTISTIDLPLGIENDLVIQFRVIRYLSQEILDSLRLRVNGLPIELKRHSEKFGKVIFEGSIPKSALTSRKNFSRLEFEIDKTTNPHFENPDDPTNRNLGIAINKINFTPKAEYNPKRDSIEILDQKILNEKNQQLLIKLDKTYEQNEKWIRSLSKT